MKAIELLQQDWEQIKRLAVHAQYCAESDIRTVDCHDFSMWNVYVSFASAGLIAFLVGKPIFKAQLELYRNKKRLEARKIVADAETIEEVKWGGDDADVPLSQEALAEEIRKAPREKAPSVIVRV